jgi:acetyltransferase-like isoleucine patch superfamily enzyme
MKRKGKMARQEPEFNEMGMTQWYWRVSHRENFKLGVNTEIGSFTMIDAQEGVEIQDDVKIGFGCIILSHSSIDEKNGKVTLRKGCKIGANSTVMPNIEIGENSIIGANSFVNHSIPSNETWIGSPARFYKKNKA